MYVIWIHHYSEIPYRYRRFSPFFSVRVDSSSLLIVQSSTRVMFPSFCTLIHTDLSWEVQQWRGIEGGVGWVGSKDAFLKSRCSWSIAACSIFFSRSTRTNLSLIKEYFTFCVPLLLMCLLCCAMMPLLKAKGQCKTKSYVLGARPHFSNAISYYKHTQTHRQFSSIFHVWNLNRHHRHRHHYYQRLPPLSVRAIYMNR